MDANEGSSNFLLLSIFTTAASVLQTAVVVAGAAVREAAARKWASATGVLGKERDGVG